MPNTRQKGKTTFLVHGDVVVEFPDIKLPPEVAVWPISFHYVAEKVDPSRIESVIESIEQQGRERLRER